jgi:hypothetical protein
VLCYVSDKAAQFRGAGAVVTRLTPEQRRKLAEYATAPRAKRLRNMRWLDENEWCYVTSEALALCHKHRKPIPEALPKYVKNDQERMMEPLECWFTQRLKAAYKRWKRKRVTPEFIDTTLREMMPGEAASDVALELERDESASSIIARLAQEGQRLGGKLTKAQRAALLDEMKPGLDANVGRPFECARRTAAPTSSDDANDSTLSWIDRALNHMAGPESFKPGKERKATTEERLTGKQVVMDIERQHLAIRARRTWLLSIIPKEVKGSFDLPRISDGALEKNAAPFIAARQVKEARKQARLAARAEKDAVRAAKRGSKAAQVVEAAVV